MSYTSPVEKSLHVLYENAMKYVPNRNETQQLNMRHKRDYHSELTNLDFWILDILEITLTINTSTRSSLFILISAKQITTMVQPSHNFSNGCHKPLPHFIPFIIELYFIKLSFLISKTI